MDPCIDSSIIERVIAQLNPRNCHSPTMELYGLEDEQLQIKRSIQSTFQHNEGKSMILIGPRGSGKTTLLNQVITQLKKDWQFITIRISGSFCKDDKMAIKEIARQLDQYLQRGYIEQKSVSNTLNSILKLLEREGNKMPIIFIIDEIDVFAGHSKQTLLYNLFDLAQGRSKKSGICVIGISCKVTVRESLEKRVKSRFSQRLIQINKTKTLQGFSEIIWKLCCLKNEDQWNALIRKLIFDKGSRIRKCIVKNFYTIKDIGAIRNELIPVFYQILQRKKKDEVKYNSMLDYINKDFQLINSLSELEMKLLACCCRVKVKNSIHIINFDFVFEEYLALVGGDKRELQSRLETVGVSMKKDDYTKHRDTLLISWERLTTLGILCPVSNKGTQNGKSGQLTLCECSIEMDELIESIDVKRNGNHNRDWLNKWCKI
ncbi:origin recognition complex subunit 4 [Martiniozyma asiatica (nom. inval.)]|nr:origin recognition complex subunit 4 [Martiniozyma asiatica]